MTSPPWASGGGEHRVVVVGAGYTGLSVARRLARRLQHIPVAVTLVAPDTVFVERIRMHQVAAGQELPSHRLSDLTAGTRVQLRRARMSRIDLDQRTMTITDAAGSEELRYNTLVCALGSGWSPDGRPGVNEYGYNIAGMAGALELRDELARLSHGQTVTVVGGGLTGLEAAAEIAESRPELSVRLLTRGTLGAWLSPAGRRHVRKVFDRLGIEVCESTHATGVGNDFVMTEGGHPLGTDAVVWTTGFAIDELAAVAGIQVAQTGQIVVDRDMRSVSHPSVFAIGDIAHATGLGGTPLRMSCASGIPTAWRAADAIAAQLGASRRPRLPIGYVNQCISLGRRDGLIQFVRFDDRPINLVITGRAAAIYKEWVCRGAKLAAAGLGSVTLPRRAQARRCE